MPSSTRPGYICTVTFPCPGLSDPDMVPADASKWLQEPSSPQPSGKAEAPYDCLHLTMQTLPVVWDRLRWHLCTPQPVMNAARKVEQRILLFKRQRLVHCLTVVSFPIHSPWSLWSPNREPGLNNQAWAALELAGCSHLILGIFLVRGEAVHSKATGSVVWCWNSCETEI